MDKIFGLIGLAKRAGKIAGGDFSVTASIKEKKAELVILACDASDNTKKSMIDACNNKNIQYIEYGTMEDLGKFTGSSIRASIAVLDKGFKKAVLDKINS